METNYHKQRTFSQESILKSFPSLFKDPDRRFTASSKKRPIRIKPKPAEFSNETADKPASSYQTFHETSFHIAYKPLSRVFTSPVIGEVKLPRNGFQLVDTLHIGSVFAGKPLKLDTPPVQPLGNVESFKLQTESIRPSPNGRPRFKKCLQRSLKELKNLQITAADATRLDSIVCKKPYDKPMAHEFIKACKVGNSAEVSRLIAMNRYIVHVFDCMEMTGLHWAVLRSHTAVIRLLIDKKAFPDAIDLVQPTQAHRTPLHIAARMNLVEPVMLLLTARADPYIKTTGQQLAIKLAKNLRIVEMLHKAMLVRTIQITALQWAAPKEKREEIWQMQGASFLSIDS
jgi:hypothetical protein